MKKMLINLSDKANHQLKIKAAKEQRNSLAKLAAEIIEQALKADGQPDS